jgi:hypothetical protein
MKTKPPIVELLKRHDWNAHPPATEEMIRDAERKFGVARFPPDYRELLLFSNGGSLEGFATPVILYNLRRVLALFREHDLYEEIPDSIIFGGDGGGTVYAYDLRRRGRTAQRPIFVVRELESSYDKILSRSANLTRMMLSVIDNEEVNERQR